MKFRASRWKWPLAIGVTLAVHGVIYLGFIDRRHRPPEPPPPMVVTIERPSRPLPPPPPPEPPKPPEPARANLRVPQAAPEAAPPDLPRLEVRATPPSPQVQAAPPTGPVPRLNLGCPSAVLKGKAKDDCERQAFQDQMKRSDGRKTEFPVQGPLAEAASPQPGLSIKGLGAAYTYDPEDKHFLPGFGKSKTRVVKPAEIHDVPQAQR